MRRVGKILITTIILLILILPVGYFLVYPNYNKVIGPLKRFDILRSTQEITFQVLTELVPVQNNILEVTLEFANSFTMEESLGSDIVLEETLLEDLNTKIIINSIEVEGYVYEGVEPKTMNRGFWHFPISNLPGQKGNLVIIGHRYAKLPPKKDTFFNLDKVQVGDTIQVVQSTSEYTYIVTDTIIAEKNDISVLQDYSDYRITLITCTPLWTANQRLVIVGKLDKLYKNT